MGHFRKTCFCRELAELQKSPQQVPKLVVALIEHVQKHGLQTENLFLESGDALLVQEIQDCIDHETGLPDDYNTEKHMHSIAETLLCFLESLPRPLIPPMAYKAAATLGLVLQRLPEENEHLCGYLISFIKDRLLANNASLTPKDLAVVFAKVFAQDDDDALELAALLERELTTLPVTDSIDKGQDMETQ